MQDRPRCFECAEEVDAASSVFEAPCGHEECPSAVFHGLCLMSWREDRDRVMARLREIAAEYFRRGIIE